jgi:Transposase DNA-binding
MSSEDEQTWMDKENAACYFRDERLKKRFQLLLKQFWMGMGQSIPFACQDWASTKAAYRFFANDHVSEKDILSGRFQCVKRAFREFRMARYLFFKSMRSINDACLSCAPVGRRRCSRKV